MDKGAEVEVSGGGVNELAGSQPDSGCPVLVAADCLRASGVICGGGTRQDHGSPVGSGNLEALGDNLAQASRRRGINQTAHFIVYNIANEKMN